jgi:uncharacterized damage-inducible protein DinB
MRRVLGIAFLFAQAPVLAPAVAAQAAQQAAPPVEISVRAELLRQYDDAAGKIVRLAEKMPAEAYGWQPMEGVRTTSRVFMHMAAACYNYGRALGATVPDGVNPRELEQITDKDRVVAELKKAVEFGRAAIASADLEKEITFRRRPGAAREIALALAIHMHEHLGQAIAYARSNKVVPPWSEN